MNSKFFIDKVKTVFLVYAIVFIPIWSIFLLNNVIFNSAFTGFCGIHPRDISLLGILPIFTSWAFHGSIQGHMMTHIVSNSSSLLFLLMIIALIETKPIKIILSLIVLSGFATWIIGLPNSVHVGASGLIFAILGYVIYSVIFGRKWLYIIPIFFMGGQYLYSLQVGLIPQEGVSFAGHFGGFVSGLTYAYFYHKEANSKFFKAIKDKYDTLMYKIRK